MEELRDESEKLLSSIESAMGSLMQEKKELESKCRFVWRPTVPRVPFLQRESPTVCVCRQHCEAALQEPGLG